MLRISVIGGGLGGLAFAQGMRRLAGYQVTVYERDKSPSQRSQGYQIGLNEQGLDALKSLELPGFTELIRENPLFGFMMTDSKLDALVRFSIGGTSQEPKTSLVNRWKLHDLLMEGIDIQWDKKFVSYEEKNDCIIATFEDGTTATSALLVGADGVNSKVRAQYRPDLVFEKTGITSIAGFFPVSLDTNNELPLMRDYVQNNLGRALLPNTNTLLFMKFLTPSDGQENLLWSLSFKTDAAREKFGDLPSNLDALKEDLLRRSTEMGCSSEISRAIALTPLENFMRPNETVTMRPTKDAHVRPADLPQTKCRVVLLGDAAHAMTTHAGRGANTAFLDAHQLAFNILSDPSRDLRTQLWPESHAMYEKMMWKIGHDSVKASLDNTERIHKDNNEGGISFMRGMGYCVKAWNFVTKGKFGF